MHIFQQGVSLLIVCNIEGRWIGLVVGLVVMGGVKDGVEYWVGVVNCYCYCYVLLGLRILVYLCMGVMTGTEDTQISITIFC